MPQIQTVSTNKQDPGFSDMFGQSIKIFFTNLHIFIPLVIAFALTSIASMSIFTYIGVTNLYQNIGLAVSLFIFVMTLLIILQTTFTLALTFASSNILHNKNINAGTSINYGIHNFLSGVNIMLKVFWYVLKVVLIGLIPLIAILVIYPMVLSAGSTGFSSLLSSGDIMGGNGPITSIESSTSSLISMGLSALSFIAMIAVFVLGALRGVRSIFALLAMVEDKLKGKDALNQSIKIATGHFWKIFGYIMFTSILLTIISTITLFAIEFLQSELLYTIVNLLFTASVGPITIIFLNILYINLKKQHN